MTRRVFVFLLFVLTLGLRSPVSHCQSVDNSVAGDTNKPKSSSQVSPIEIQSALKSTPR